MVLVEVTTVFAKTLEGGVVAPGTFGWIHPSIPLSLLGFRSTILVRFILLDNPSVSFPFSPSFGVETGG